MFERPSYISEEVWNQKFPTMEVEAASPQEIEQALDHIAEEEGVNPSPPWMTISLIGANTALFLAGMARGLDPIKPDIASLTRWGANVGPMVIGGQWWRLLTCMFLHIGAIHLLFNMIVLWYIGKFIERFLGRTGFAVVYLLAGLGGSLVSILWAPGRVSAGASGAIFGLYGALFGFLTKESQCVPAKVRNDLLKSAGLFVAYNLIQGLGNQGIDMAAHIGGLVSGWLFGVAISLPTTPAGVAKRPKTNALALGIGLTFFGAMVAFLPKMTGPTGDLVQGQKAEAKAMEIYNRSLEDFRKGRINNIQFADTLETKVVPGLQDCFTKFGSCPGVPGISAERVEAIADCTKKRIIGLDHLADAIRRNDAMGARAAHKEEEDALKELQAQQ